MADGHSHPTSAGGSCAFGAILHSSRIRHACVFCIVRLYLPSRYKRFKVHDRCVRPLRAPPPSAKGAPLILRLIIKSRSADEIILLGIVPLRFLAVGFSTVYGIVICYVRVVAVRERAARNPVLRLCESLAFPKPKSL